MRTFVVNCKKWKHFFESSFLIWIGVDATLESLEQFFSRDILQQNSISYKDALEEVVTILMEGILA